MLARAEHHIIDFSRQTDAFFTSHPYSEVTERDPNTRKNLHKIKFTERLPVMLNGIASDAILNMRAALDQAGYIAAGSKGRDTHFPFGDTPAEVKSRQAGGSRDIPDAIFTVMESFQPYFRPDDLLWCLNKLSNANKHRLIVPTAIVAPSGRITGKFKHSGKFALLSPKWDRAKNEILFAQSSGDTEGEADVNLQFFIAFGEVEFVARHPATGVLNTMANKVKDVLTAVEAEGRRTGLFK